MAGTLWVSVFALAAYLVYFSGLYFVKKTDNKLNGILWGPIIFLLGICFNAFLVGVVNLISIPITLFSVSVMNIISGGICWFFIVKKGKQAYFFSLCDVFCFIPLILVAAYFSIEQFGRELYPLYATSDPGVHLRVAVQSMLTEKPDGMFFAGFLNGMIIEFFGAFVKFTHNYAIFVLTDAAMYMLSGVMFYCVTASLTKKVGSKIIAMVMAIFYMLGYPLNNMAFGFTYLGMAVTILLLILFLTEHYINHKLDKGFNLIALMTTCFSIAICYSIFAPVTFVGVFVSVAIVFVKEKKLFSWRFVFEELKIFLVPCILAVYYFFVTWGPEATAIGGEGYIYRNLFSNFVFLLTPLIIVVVYVIKKKENDEAVPMLFALLLWLGATFLLGLKGSVSSYYFYKSYFVLWAICFYLAFKAALIFEEKALIYAVGYMITPVLLVVIGTSNIEDKIRERNILFSPDLYADRYFDVYHNSSNLIVNDNEFDRRRVWRARIELYDYAYENCMEEGQVIPLIDHLESVYWYEGIMGQENVYWWLDKEAKLQEIEDSSYIIVLPNTEIYSSGDAFYEEYAEYFNSLEKVFENELGFVAKVSGKIQ